MFFFYHFFLLEGKQYRTLQGQDYWDHDYTKKNFFSKKQLHIPFLWIAFKGVKENHYEETILLTTKLPGVRGIQLIDLQRMKR